MDRELDNRKLKYVLYVRKSTEDESRQIKSISDQISECQEFAKRIKINIVDILQESKSAKKSNNRAIFTQMLKDIKHGKYDGIVAWHPDRLSRNMLEGGQIIELIDQGEIKDLKFVTHHFENDPSGKMLLGMAFVLSKEYSDRLSSNVTRGVRSNFQQGIIASYKHGYKKDSSNRFIPDDSNFQLIRKAWEMRIEGASLTAIVNYLNENNYHRKIERTKRIVRITKQMLSNLFKDPFYYGILIQTNQNVDLNEIYDFKALISEEEFVKVQLLDNKRAMTKLRRSKLFKPLRSMVICSYCRKAMIPCVSSNHDQRRYFYYRCDTKYCDRAEYGYKRSVRAYVIFDYIYSLIESGLKFDEITFNRYRNEISNYSESKFEELQRALYSKNKLVATLRTQYDDIALKALDESDERIKRVASSKLEQLSNDIDAQEQESKKISQKLSNKESNDLTLKDFLNLTEKISAAIKTPNPVLKDAICRLLFLNFEVGDQKVLSYQLKPPFNVMMDMQSVLSSRGKRT